MSRSFWAYLSQLGHGFSEDSPTFGPQLLSWASSLWPFSSVQRQTFQPSQSVPQGTQEAVATGSFSPVQTTLSQGNPNVLRWLPYIQEASQKLGVPADVIAAIMELESGGNPQALSPAGAVGLMQVMPQYHSWRAEKYGGSLQDPRVNVLVGAEILKQNYDRIKTANPSINDDEAWKLAAAAYFGAFDWNSLRVTGAQDALGTSGHRYVQAFENNRQKYRAGPSPAGSPVTGPLPVSSWTGNQSFPLTQGFGQTEFARTSGFYRNNFHPGIDIGAPQGTRITAPLSGRVVQAGWNGGYGYSVTLEVTYQGKTYHILIGHMADQPMVAPGQVVSPGQVLGLVGSTGVSTGPHIHLEVREGGQPVDPRVLFLY